MTYTLAAAGETIQLPNYPASPPYEITGNSQVPTTTNAGSVLTIELSQNKFTNGNGSFPSPSGTVDFYTTLEFNESTTFGNGSTSLKIPVTIISPCVTNGTAYTTTEASGGITVYSETDTATMNGSVTGHIEAALNPVPANTVVYITVSH